MIIRVILVLLIAIAACLVWIGPSTVYSQSTVATPVPQRRELSLQEKRGKAFYLRGESASGQEITAMMGEVDVPASTLTCAGVMAIEGRELLKVV